MQDMMHASPGEVATVGELLARAGVQLAILETVTAGAVAAHLRAAPGGAEFLTAAHVIHEPAALVEMLHVSRAKIDAFGFVSEMVAAEAAAALIDTYEGGWGLAILGNQAAAPGVSEEAGAAIIALGTPSATRVRHCSVAAAPHTALELLRGEVMHG